MTAHDLAQGSVEMQTDLDFADLPPGMQADLVSWWQRCLDWRREIGTIIPGEISDSEVVA